MNKTYASTGISVFATLIMFFAFQAISVDLIKDYVNRAVDNSLISDLVTANFILAIYIMFLFLAFMVSNLLVFRNVWSIAVALLIFIFSLIVMLIIAAASVFNIYGMEINLDVVVVLFPLFAVNILRNPAIFMLLLSSIYVVSITFANEYVMLE